MEYNKKLKSQFFTVALGQAVSMLGSHGVQFALICGLLKRPPPLLCWGYQGLQPIFQ